eukprot:326061-Chlamydomonas_euryale.AAC.1
MRLPGCGSEWKKPNSGGAAVGSRCRQCSQARQLVVRALAQLLTFQPLARESDATRRVLRVQAQRAAAARCERSVQSALRVLACCEACFTGTR